MSSKIKKEASDSILEPHERLKALIDVSNAVEVDPNIRPTRYYRSGLEMVRMANVYMEEGSIENAYILYLKFMTLFLEKIRKHPEYNSVTVSEKAINQAKLREVLPKAEKLKTELLERYTRDYNRYLQEAKRRAEETKKLEEARKQQQLKQKVLSQHDPLATAVDLKIPNKVDSINYPDPDATSQPLTMITTATDVPSIPSIQATPAINRSVKPPTDSSSTTSLAKSGLRIVVIPKKLMSHFLILSNKNTLNNVETCGILAGKLEKNELIVTHMILPKQKGTPDSCSTMNEEEIFDYQDHHNLITVGWIHTHPTQTAFLSSVDLHTHCPYQLLMPEAIAIVCAPKYDETGFFILTPNYGLQYIAKCRKSGFHPHPTDPPLFMNAEHIKIDNNAALEVLDLRIS